MKRDLPSAAQAAQAEWASGAGCPEVSGVHHRTLHLPDDAAFEAWQAAVARTYRVERAHDIARLPRGGLTHHVLDGIIVHRSCFPAQRAVRDKRLVDSTPDNFMLQFWRKGGYRGSTGSEPVTVRKGHVVLANRRRELDIRFDDSEMLGLIVPRERLHGLPVDDRPATFDPLRARLAAARLQALHHLMPRAKAADVPRISAELLAFVRRLLDPSPAGDVLHAPDLDRGVADLAREVIAANLGSRTLSPELIAASVGVSRAGLYRAFDPVGGVMACVWDLRLDAARAAILDPHARRSIGQIASDLGFASASHLSRSFGRRFGMSPRACQASRGDAGGARG